MDSLVRLFRVTRAGCLAALPLLVSTPVAPAALAQKAEETKCAETKCKEEKPPPPEEVLSTTEHTVEIGGVEVDYRATAGNLLLKEEDGTAKASVFFVAYERLGEGGAGESPGQRPVTFAFNGGPGSSSVWLHLGLLGPRRVDMGEEGWSPPPPYRLVDNRHSLLDVTDLVSSIR